MPRMTTKPVKWAIYHTWRPLTFGPERWPNLTTFIGGWWGLYWWCDREFCALYDTREEATKDADEIVSSDPEEWSGKVFVAPTARRLGEEKLVSVIREVEARKKAEAEEADRRFREWYDAETKRLEAALSPEGRVVRRKT